MAPRISRSMYSVSRHRLHRSAELRALREHLDPFDLARAIDRKLERISTLADRRLSPQRPISPSRSVTF